MQEQLDNGSPEGCQVRGLHRQVVQGMENTTLAYQLNQDESGALVISNAADGAVYTLPDPVVGMQFEFSQNVAITSNEFKVVTRDISTQFITGGVYINSTTSGGGNHYTADGTTHAALVGNGTTTGGLAGGTLVFTAISSTLWQVKGSFSGSGTTSTPFAAS